MCNGSFSQGALRKIYNREFVLSDTRCLNRFRQSHRAAKFVLFFFQARGAFNGYLEFTRTTVVFKYYPRKHVVNVKGKHNMCMLLVCGYATNGKVDNAIK